MTAGSTAKSHGSAKLPRKKATASKKVCRSRGSKSATHSRGKAASSRSIILIDRIIRLLEASDPVEMPPKVISTRLRARPASVRKAIQREMDSGHSRIVSVGHGGWYRAARNIDRIRALGTAVRLELHGIKLEGKCHAANAGHSIVAASSHKYRKRGIFKEGFEGRVVTIIVHEMNLVEVFLETSKVPMDFTMFEKFCYWLYGKMDGIVLEFEWRIVELGINADAHNMMTDGLKRISLKDWRNAWFQIYQKEKDVVRFETHIMPDLQLQDCLSIMGNFVNWVETTRRAIPEQTEQKYTPSKNGNYDPSFA